MDLEPDWVVLRAGPDVASIAPLIDGQWMNKAKMPGMGAVRSDARAGVDITIMLPGLPMIDLHPTDELVTREDGAVGQVYVAELAT